MEDPPKIQIRDRTPEATQEAQLQQKNNASQKPKITITVTQTSNGVPDQIIHPMPNIPSSSSPPHSGSVASETGTQTSESGCSAQTQKTGTTTTAAIVLLNDGIEYYKQGKYEHALKTFNSVLKSQMFRRAEDDDPILAVMLANCGSVFFRQGRYDHAIEWLENAVKMTRRSKLKRGTDKDQQRAPFEFPLSEVLNNLGTAKSLSGEHQAGLECYWEAIKEAKTSDGQLKKGDMSNSFYNIGRISLLQEDYSTALNSLTKSLTLGETIHGEKSIECVDTLNLIGFVHYSTGAFDRAISVFTEALSIVTASFGSVHEKVAVSLINVGMVLEKEGDLDEALRCFSTAQEVCEKVGLGEEDRTMQTAIRSASDIRRELSLARQAEISNLKKGNSDTPNQSEKTLPSSSPKADTTSNNNDDTRSEIGSESSCNMSACNISAYAAFRERRKTKGATTEYREDPNWEIDDSSIVEESREN